MNPADEELVDDLLAQLDSRDKTVQAESALVLNEVQINQAASNASKPDAKSRFKARLVSDSSSHLVITQPGQALTGEESGCSRTDVLPRRPRRGGAPTEGGRR